MKPKSILSLILLLSSYISFAQPDSKDFPTYARYQDSLMMDAYYAKDINKYNVVLEQFMGKYNLLSKEEQGIYSPSLYNAYYNLSCTYSLLKDKENGLKYFKKAVDAGYLEYLHVMQDTDLDILRKEPGFIETMKMLQSVGDYQFILRNAQEHKTDEYYDMPEFRYMSLEDENLVELRSAFNLDSIAGKGTQQFQAINLLHWIHYLIPHDGQHDNPTVKNAMSMIAECKKGNRGLNCRGLATVLNECYLSMGFKARMITCNPKDSLGIDPDCHVINTVWIDELYKWVWFDPTNDAYLMDEKGTLQSIQEVREKISNGSTLILNPEANWNRISTTIDYYIYQYMAKNLYMLECPVVSQYNMETREEGRIFKYVRLMPKDYFKVLPPISEQQNEAKTNTWITYNIYNPAEFWK